MFRMIAIIAVVALADAPVAAVQADEGVTSGPAAGSNVDSSAAVQKANPAFDDSRGQTILGPGGVSVGAPGVEGKKGTQSGQEWAPPQEIRSGPRSARPTPRAP